MALQTSQPTPLELAFPLGKAPWDPAPRITSSCHQESRDGQFMSRLYGLVADGVWAARVGIYVISGGASADMVHDEDRLLWAIKTANMAGRRDEPVVRLNNLETHRPLRRNGYASSLVEGALLEWCPADSFIVVQAEPIAGREEEVTSAELKEKYEKWQFESVAPNAMMMWRRWLGPTDSLRRQPIAPDLHV